MYKLIDVEYKEIYSPFTIDVELYYKLCGLETYSNKWVNERTYLKLKEEKLIEENE